MSLMGVMLDGLCCNPSSHHARAFDMLIKPTICNLLVTLFANTMGSDRVAHCSAFDSASASASTHAEPILPVERQPLDIVQLSRQAFDCLR